MSTDTEDDYRVGKGKPPLATRFKPGVSGNPDGARRHRKGVVNSTAREIAMSTANELIGITINGKRTRVPRKVALMLAVNNDALNGTPAHRLKALRLLADIGAFDVDPQARVPSAEARRTFLDRLAREAQMEQEG